MSSNSVRGSDSITESLFGDVHSLFHDVASPLRGPDATTHSDAFAGGISIVVHCVLPSCTGQQWF